jgi:hypothetical protein
MKPRATQSASPGPRARDHGRAQDKQAVLHGLIFRQGVWPGGSGVQEALAQPDSDGTKLVGLLPQLDACGDHLAAALPPEDDDDDHGGPRP